MKTQITYSTFDFIVENMTDEQKEVLRIEKPDLHKKFIKTIEKKITTKKIKKDVV